MFIKLGKIIEKRPWFIITIIVLITIGFSIVLPGLEFRTDFNEFMPDDEIAQANERVQDYFGASQLPMFVLAEKQNSKSVITSQAIREIYQIEKKLTNNPEVEGVISFTTFLNTICTVEFGKNIDNCTDEQLQIALEDLLKEIEKEELTVFISDDPNEAIDYKRFPRISRGESADSADIKNCFISKDDESITFSFEVYDLSELKNTLRPSFTNVNVMEWYLDFENLIKPDEQLDISYRISAHIEPTYPLWEIGKGVLENLRNILSSIRQRALFNSYNMEAYLWIKPPEQSMYFPIPLTTGNITFDENRITVKISREELGQYGIATSIGAFELPAKLSNFSAGVRYYQIGLFKRPGGRIITNTTFLFGRLERIQSRPILGTIASRLIERYGGISWEDFNQMFAMMEQSELPETIALKDIDSSWIKADVVPDTGSSDNIYYIVPFLFENLQLNSISFLSDEYKQTGAPKATLFIIQLDVMGEEYAEMLRINNEIVKTIEELDQQYNSVKLEVTGELVVSSQIEDLTNEAFQILGPAMFIIIVLILFISFRKTSYVLLPMVALLVSTIWLFGTMTLLGIALNVIAVALVPLILGLGVDYSVHIFHNYRAELEKGKTPAQAIKRSVKDIGSAMSLAWLTTVIAFMSFLSSSILPIRQFGVLLAVGITYTFITAITLLASVRYVLDRRKPPVIKKRLTGLTSKFALKPVMGKIASVVLCHQKKMFALLILITVIFATGAIQLERGFDFDQFVPPDNPAMELFDTIADYFPYASEYQEYIIIEGDVATVSVLRGIRETHEKIEDDSYISKNEDGSIKVSSIYSEIQLAIKNDRSLIEKFNIDESTGIPKTDNDVKELFNYLYEGPSTEVEGIETGDFNMEDFGASQIKMVLYRNNSRYSATLVRYYLDASFQLEGGNLQDNLELLNKELNEDVSDYGDAEAIVTGMSQIQLTNTNSLFTSQIIASGISIMLAAFVLIIAYRNLTLGLITMVPVGVSIIWIMGTMFYFGYILDVMTVTVTSITIGIGIDYAIHATQRFRLVARKTGDVTEAVCETISHTGGALLIAALTTALAFGILILAPIPPQQRFGIILATTISYSFLTSVLFLPLFLARWGQWRKKRRGYVISPGQTDDELDD